MKIAISSGKGGTGKTFVSTNLARLAADLGEEVTYIDCDVEEPNGHLFLDPEGVTSERVTVASPVRIDPERCTGCGECVDACRYNALVVVGSKGIVFEELCHACGVCGLVCPEGAVIEGDREIGELAHGASRGIGVHWGLLRTAAGGMSPRLIRALKPFAGRGLTILDSPPGTACSAVETVKGADLVVLVTDPTPFSVHDLGLSVSMCRQIGQEPVVAVNRAGIDDGDLKAYCERAEIEIIAEVPDDREIARAYSVGDLAVQKIPRYRRHFGDLLERAREAAGRDRPVRTDLIEPAFREGGEVGRAGSPGSRARRPSEVAVISGKGGTGKTSIVACFAQLAAGSVLSDCDVDASDLHLVLDPEVRSEGDFVGGIEVEIDGDLCTGCGRCDEVCRFGAILEGAGGARSIDASACEGCGACEVVCQEGAVSSRDAVNGRWFVSTTRFGPMTHAILGWAEENSGRLVSLVREKAADLAQEGGAGAGGARDGSPGAILDGSPGTGCPVIASITGARYAVVVTEPTVSGLHDLVRVLDLARHFGVPAGVVVNKADLNEDMAARIAEAAREAGADLLGSVPYDGAFTEAQIRRRTLLEHVESDTSEAVRSIFQKLIERL